MPHADFVHLRVHSAYSLSEGAIKVKELVKLCAQHAMPAVAVTDTGNLFGALEFALAAADSGVQPIIGCQIGISAVKAGTETARCAAVTPGKQARPDQLVLLAQNEAGYRRLMQLVSQSYLETDPGAEPHIAWHALEAGTEGLLAFTGGPAGPVGRLLGEGQASAAASTLDRLKRLFPNRLYVELMRHAGELGELETRIEPALIDLAYAQDIPLIATNDCFFADEGMYEAHDALLCIADGRYVGEQDRRRLTPDHRFKSPAEMRALFADVPEAVDNTLVVAQRCSFLLKPIKPLLPAFPTVAGRTEAEELKDRAAKGLGKRLESHVFTPDLTPQQREETAKTYRDRLDHELATIEAMKFPGYFLIVSDFIQWTKDQGIPVGPGRGSGAGSVVAWALTITDLDPLRFGLLFERFLNPERVSMPDFDIDFCQDRRDEVIHYVQRHYGHDKVAQIITFGKLQARAVLRDVGRVLQLPFPVVDKLCKLVPNNPANPVTLKQAIDGEPVLQQRRDEDPDIARLMEIALKLEGLYRHASTHAAGVVIGDRPLHELVALYRDPRSDMPVTQFNMKFVEQAGLVKFDFLGLKTLTVLQKAVAMTGQAIDLSTLPLDDEKSYALLSRAESTGVFQLESSGMRDILRRLKPNRFEEIIALVALYRPGPMDNIPKFIRVKNGDEEPDYPHPLLEPILKETFGIMVYQEQVMQAAQILAGYSLGGADLLRRAMGKKIQAEMDAQRALFVKGAGERGIGAEQASSIFDLIAKFAGYGFNKSHAAAYALVAYQTAWMKANYPVEFLAASMTYDMANTDRLNFFRQELQRMGIQLLPPDVNSSEAVFSCEVLADGTKAIRYALAGVKGVGEQAMRALVDERTRGGRFKSLFDFARRVDAKVMNKRQLETLASAGGFDTLNKNRAQAHGSAELLTRFAHTAAGERESGQSSLFGGPGATVALKEPPLPDVSDWDPLEKLRHEFEAIGFYLSAHPLDTYALPLKRLKTVRATETGGAARRQMGWLHMAGIVVARQFRTAKSGNRFAFVSLSDSSGVFEVTVFSELLATARELLEPGKLLSLKVEPQGEGDELRLTAHEIAPLEEVLATVAEGIAIVLRDPAAVPGLKEELAKAKATRGRAKVTVLVDLDQDGDVEIDLPGPFALSAGLRHSLQKLPGVVEVREM